MLLEISVDQKQLASIIFSFPITDLAINSSRFPQIFLPFATPSNSHLFALNLNILDSSSPLLVGRYSESPQPGNVLLPSLKLLLQPNGQKYYQFSEYNKNKYY
uniref:Uncharacterized protein n=1 Tax=Gossypium raimondii TaxID=29730 RepID=A0A0D2QLA3_GOSRA|nr:hypothetical protein B456_003G153600 [Gossypium raimondii]